MKNRDAVFTVLSHDKASDRKPIYAIEMLSEVHPYVTEIENESRNQGVDPDLVKAIVHLESTQGWYDRIALGAKKSYRPMNIHAKSRDKYSGRCFVIEAYTGSYAQGFYC